MANRPLPHRIDFNGQDVTTVRQLADRLARLCANIDEDFQTIYEDTASASAVVSVGAALTEVDDTNVTLTLNGQPSIALLKAVQLVLGWVGQLSQARGGTGLDTSGATDGQLLIGQTSDHSLQLAALTAGANITITNAGGAITITGTGGGAQLLGAVPIGQIQAWNRRSEWFYGAVGTMFTVGQTTINQANTTTTTNAAGVWLDLGSSVSGTISHMDDNSTFCWADHNPVWRTTLTTDPSLVTLTRFWGGLSQIAFADSDSPSTASGKCIGFRYSTVAGDTGFVGVCVDGAGQTTSSLIATVAANTQYILEIVVSATGTSALFTVYNSSGVVQGTPRTITTHIPTGVAFKSAIAIIPQTAGSRHWLFRGVYAEAN